MKIRSDVAEMLRDGLTDTQIAARAHVSHRTVARARRALDIPRCRAGARSPDTLEHALRKRCRILDDGHWEWAGPTHSGGFTHFKFRGTRYTAPVAAFLVRYQRAPVGLVQAVCGMQGCVAPGHVEDRPMRDRTNDTYAAIFGGGR
ncbi:helix-turn-helix domain-containing protein [Streptomyces sp. NPDC023838]|uniref:helix-turn-helix domain-containing protein n=1 Tax=Streptomyces sp. NPDC023838 TaxID=3154325 RepID=UPI0033E95CDD